MSYHLKKISIVIIFVLLAGFMSGCSFTVNGANTGVKDGKIQLRVAWWGSQDRHDKTLRAIQLFEKENPDIHVIPEFTGWDGYWEKLATAAAGKNLPDVIQMDYAKLMEYIDRDLIVDLNPYVESGVLDLSDVGKAHIEGGYVDGKLYAVNLGTNSPAVAYNPEMFKEAGLEEFKPGYTWEDYAKVSKQLQEKFGEGLYGAGGVANGLPWFNIYLRQHGFEVYNSEGTGLGYEDDQLLIDFLEYWDDLLNEDVAAPPKVTTAIQGLEDELIVHEKSPFLWFHSNQIVALQQSAGQDIKLAVFPSTPDGKEGLYLKPSQFFSVSKQSKHQEAAAKFVDFMTNDLEANEILAAERGVPISEKVREHLRPQMNDAAKEMFDYVERVETHSSPIYPPDPPGSGEVGTLFDRIIEKLNYGNISVEEAATQFRKEAEEILAKNK
ncbi:sugar ABC transporter substrate-binding protein [uncultured Metabacillus sp.]|uniref:ABC transporter substrate-binding protein n=1 Tax=uncultured Metabacillus sp. TaxID=2860135 RepID=UPI00262E785B|nr:sugar ABC transporter substrate-binding protein [uncultured Metabacillus sp.]